MTCKEAHCFPIKQNPLYNFFFFFQTRLSKFDFSKQNEKSKVVTEVEPPSFLSFEARDKLNSGKHFDSPAMFNQMTKEVQPDSYKAIGAITTIHEDPAPTVIKTLLNF